MEYPVLSYKRNYLFLFGTEPAQDLFCTVSPTRKIEGIDLNRKHSGTLGKCITSIEYTGLCIEVYRHYVSY